MKKKTVFRFNVFLIVCILFLSFFSGINKVDAFEENKEGSFSVRTFFLKISGGISDFFSSFVHHSSIKKENSQLIIENIKLRSLADENIRMKKENDLLKEALDLKKDMGWNFDLVDVIGRPSLNFSKELILGKGEKDGFDVEQSVIWEEKSLIGKIREVKDNISFVQVVGDDDFRASVFVGPNRLEAIFKGQGLKTPILEMLSADNNVSIGDSIFTSGLDQKFPKGLFLGKVKTIRKTEGKAFLDVEVDLSFNWSELEQVLVIE